MQRVYNVVVITKLEHYIRSSEIFLAFWDIYIYKNYKKCHVSIKERCVKPRGVQCIKHVRVYVSGPGIRGTQVKSSVRMKKPQYSSK